MRGIDFMTPSYRDQKTCQLPGRGFRRVENHRLQACAFCGTYCVIIQEFSAGGVVGTSSTRYPPDQMAFVPGIISVPCLRRNKMHKDVTVWSS